LFFRSFLAAACQKTLTNWRADQQIGEDQLRSDCDQNRSTDQRN